MSFGNPLMGREPRAQQRPVALAGVDVNLSINVFTVSVDHGFTLESVVFPKWIIRAEPVGIDG